MKACEKYELVPHPAFAAVHQEDDERDQQAQKQVLSVSNLLEVVLSCWIPTVQ